jgi:hypothetical protein
MNDEWKLKAIGYVTKETVRFFHNRSFNEEPVVERVMSHKTSTYVVPVFLIRAAYPLGIEEAGFVILGEMTYKAILSLGKIVAGKSSEAISEYVYPMSSKLHSDRKFVLIKHFDQNRALAEKLFSVSAMTIDDSTALASLMQQFREREQTGIKKYGKTVDRDDLSLDQWEQHLKEELMDALMYIEARQQAAKRKNSPST